MASPTLRSLLLDIQQSGPASAEGRFWERIQASGAPIQEPTRDPSIVLVTFLFRGDSTTQHVVVLGGATGWQIEETKMHRVPETDVWYHSREYPSNFVGSYRICPNDSLVAWEKEKNLNQRRAAWLTDPLNRHSMDFSVPDTDGPRTNPASILQLRDAAQNPYCEVVPGIPRGTLTRLEFKSSILNNTRAVWIYTPAGYSPTGADRPYGALLVFDGGCYISAIPTPTILDNLIASGRVPPLVGIFVDSSSQEARDTELPCDPNFTAMISNELLPWVRSQYAVTADPERLIAAGSSYGGLASLFLAVMRPDVCRNVLSQSGSFGTHHEIPLGPGLIERIISARASLPLHAYLDAGEFETAPYEGRASIATAHARMQPMLRERARSLVSRTFCGYHDYACWRTTLSDGILALTAHWAD